jgi:hypothetical protein
LLGCVLALNAIPGVTIESDLGSPIDDGGPLVGSAPLAQSFTPTAAYTVTSVVVDLSNAPFGETARPAKNARSMGRSVTQRTPPSRPDPAPVTPYTTATLYADGGTTPGAVLAVSPTQVLDTSLSGTPQQFTFTFSYPVAANTRYWIGLSATAGSAAFWSGSDSASGTDITSEYYEYAGTIRPDSGEGTAAFLMAVFGVVAAPTTPAPGTVWLVLFGLAGAAFYLSRRRLARG